MTFFPNTPGGFGHEIYRENKEGIERNSETGISPPKGRAILALPFPNGRLQGFFPMISYSSNSQPGVEGLDHGKRKDGTQAFVPQSVDICRIVLFARL